MATDGEARASGPYAFVRWHLTCAGRRPILPGTGVSHPLPANGRWVPLRATARALLASHSSSSARMPPPASACRHPWRAPELASRERLGMWNPLTRQRLVGTFHRFCKPSQQIGSSRPEFHRGGLPPMVRIVRRTLAALIASAAILGLAASAYAQTHPATTPAPGAAKPAAAPAGAANTGRITGRALEKGKDAVPFANVIILGTKQGTMTDETGAFVIPGVPVGSYEIKLQAIGYEAVVVKVQVNAGQTAVVNFDVGATKVVKEIETIEVRAEKRIDTKSSTTKQSISAEKLKEIPVDNLSQAVATKAGIVAQGGELHFRGGRGGEVKFQFDGVEATDPAFGGNANIASLAVAGTDVLSGGFDAEYGNALSGVVSVSTKEGTNRLGGEVRWDTDRFGDPTKTYDNYDRFTFGFGGPTPVKNLTYFATYEGTFTNTYLNSGMTLPKRTFLDFITLGNRQSNQINTNFKLAYRANPRNKITFETINNHVIDTPYEHDWSRKGYVAISYNRNPDGTLDTTNPKYGSWSATPGDTAGGVSYEYVNLADHVPTFDQKFQQFIGVWTNQISDKSVWTTRVASLDWNTVNTVGGKEPWEYWIQNPFYWSGNLGFGTEDNPFYATHGDVPVFLSQNTRVYTLKTDFSTRHWKQHTWKTGLEAKYNRAQNLSLTSPNGESNGLPGATRSDYVNFNPEGAAYLQDRWEFEGLVLNGGLRYDFFTPGQQIQDVDLTKGRYKAQFSPRLGIAYPISDRDVL